MLTLLEKLFTYYWMQQPVAAAGLFVSCNHNVPDDFALCTAVGVLHGKLTPDGKLWVNEDAGDGDGGDNGGADVSLACIS